MRLPSFSRNLPGALLVTTEAFTRRHLARILEFANGNRIPAMFEDSSWVDAGGLMSYGPNYQEVFEVGAVLVDKILKGAKPADLPVCSRPGSNWSSTSRPPRRWDSKSRRICWRSPTR